MPSTGACEYLPQELVYTYYRTQSLPTSGAGVNTYHRSLCIPFAGAGIYLPQELAHIPTAGACVIHMLLWYVYRGSSRRYISQLLKYTQCAYLFPEPVCTYLRSWCIYPPQELVCIYSRSQCMYTYRRSRCICR